MAEAPGAVNDAAAKAAGDGGRVVAYLVNQYPKVSHTFIRREILSLEKQGIAVERYALRGWDAEIADAEDRSEQSRTRYLLAGGLPALAAAVAVAFARAPVAFLRAAGLALRMAKRSHRPWPYHLVYLAEGARLAAWLRRSRASHLHAHFGTNSAEVAMLAHALGGPPYSFTVHGPEEFDAPERARARREDPSCGVRRSRSAHTGAASCIAGPTIDAWPKIHVVHCGVDARLPCAPRLS